MDENKKIYDGVCIFCDTPVSLDTGFYTDGKIFVCPICASRKTLVDVCRVTFNSNADSNIEHKFVPLYWENPVPTELDAALDSTELNSVRTEYEPEPYNPTTPINATGVVIDASTDEYERQLMSLGHEIGEDIQNLSQDDFLSKYCDNPDAIDLYLDFHPEA